jgi:acetyl esterase
MTSPLDPGYVRATALIKAAGVEPADPLKVPLDAARAAQERYFAFLAQDPPQVAAVRNFEAEGPAGLFGLRIYYPVTADVLPVILYVRGGGWWAGSLDSHDRTMRLLANESGCAVCGVDYHRAPEYRFPTQANEVLSAAKWLCDRGSTLGLDVRRVALCGESAGANLSVLAAAHLRSEECTTVTGLVLFYGNFAAPKGSARAYSKWVWSQYLGCDPAEADPAAVPLKVDPDGLPPVWLGVGDADPLLDDTVEFADKLCSAGVPCEVKIYPGLPHGFVMLNRLFDGAAAAVRDAARAAQAFTR